MPTGKVTFFHDRKGYGFLNTADSEEDIFFHVDDIEGAEPREGEEFEFEIAQSARGPRAANLKRL